MIVFCELLPTQDGIEPCLLVLQQSNNAADTANGHKPLISSTKDKIELAISCVYACDRQESKALL